MGGELDFDGAAIPSEIEDAVPDLWLGVTTHFFAIEADGRKFKVMIDGDRIKVEELL